MDLPEIGANLIFQEMPTGDSCYLDENHNPYLYISQDGRDLIDQGAALLDFIWLNYREIPQKRFYSGAGGGAVVTKETLKVNEKEIELAIKRVIASEHSVTGLEQFLATRLLQGVGVDCAMPLVASRRILISRWVYGITIIDITDDRVKRIRHELAQAANALQSNDSWDTKWKVDDRPENFILPRNSKRMLTVDPVFHYIGAKPHSFSDAEISQDEELVVKIKQRNIIGLDA